MWKSAKRRIFGCGSKARRLWRMQGVERSILVQALFWVVTLRIALYLVPFALFRRALERLNSAQNTGSVDTRPTVAQIIWAVTGVGRRIPKATCLTQALAARILLNRYHYDNQLCIGVKIGEEGEVSAHAWLEEQGQVLIGDLVDLSHYTKLPLESANVVF